MGRALCASLDCLRYQMEQLHHGQKKHMPSSKLGLIVAAGMSTELLRVKLLSERNLEFSECVVLLGRGS
jgi:hypothetical protein